MNFKKLGLIAGLVIVSFIAISIVSGVFFGAEARSETISAGGSAETGEVLAQSGDPADNSVEFFQTNLNTGDEGIEPDDGGDAGAGGSRSAPENTAIPSGESGGTPGMAEGSPKSEESPVNFDDTVQMSADCYGSVCNPTGNPIGGRTGYTRIITQTDPSVTTVVSTKDQLIAALNSAQSGDVVYVKPAAVIDLTGTPVLRIPAGVTLASNRGQSGSAGALIKRDSSTGSAYNILFIAGDGVRITGLRLQGPMAGKYNYAIPTKYNMVGIRTYDDLEVDNCEIRGFTYGGILVGDASHWMGTLNAHHNYIHHNYGIGNGYGISVVGGSALIEANIFDYNGHSITGAGVQGEKYEARYNTILGHDDPTAHHFDVHENSFGQAYSGYSYKIHHNTFYAANTASPDVRYDVMFRGATVQSGIWVTYNIFWWPESWSVPPVFSYATSKVYIVNNRVGCPPSLKAGTDSVAMFAAS